MTGFPVFDACCGGRSFWFDKADTRALFLDKRRGVYPIDNGTGDKTHGRSPVVVNPDILGDFSALPFGDDTFALVIFDPPHIPQKSEKGAIVKRYGILEDGWKETLTLGFSECFRVLAPYGTLIFKWAEPRIPIKEVLALTPEKPLIGHKTSKTTHWCVFMKVEAADAK